MSEKICIVQLADQQYYEERSNCVKSVASYCKKHGYAWQGYVGSLDENTHIAYQKPLALLRKIDEYEYVGWIDMDVTIVDRDFDLYDYLLNYNQEVVACRDPSFFRNDMINSGVLFFKSSEFCKNILAKWWGCRIEGTDKHWRHQGGGDGSADQEFISRILSANNITACNPHDLNITPRRYRIGDFAIHFMGHKPVDYDSFVAYAEKNIRDQQILNKYWMVYGFQSHDIIDRFYEYGRENVMKDNEYSPEDIYHCAKLLMNIDVIH